MFENFRKSEDMVKIKRKNSKVFGQAFFKRLAWSRGGAPAAPAGAESLSNKAQEGN